MANTFVTLQEIARLALPRLRDNLVFPGLIHRDFVDEMHGVGDVVKVRKPVMYEAGEFDEAKGVQYQDIVEDGVEVKLDHIATVDARASAIEAATCVDDLNRLFVEPAAIAIAEKINADGLKLYQDVFNCVGQAGVTPGELTDISAARRALNMMGAPMHGRCAVWDVEADAKFMSLDALVNAEKAGSNAALREGAIGRVYGLDNYMSQAVAKHVSGITAANGVKVNGAVAKGAKTLNIDGTAITGSSNLVSVVGDANIGDTLKLTVYRQGSTVELELTVGEQIQSATQEQEQTQQQQQSGGFSGFPFWGFDGFGY